MTYLMTNSKPLKIGLNSPDFRKWETIKAAGKGQEGIVIRVKNISIDSHGYLNSVQYTIYPKRQFKKKWKFKLWFKWLKLRVWIGDLYKS